MPKKIKESLEVPLLGKVEAKDGGRAGGVAPALEPVEPPVEESDDEIEKPPLPLVKEKPVKIDKRKTSVRTDKQKEAFIKVLEIRQVKRDDRAKERVIQEEELKKENEEKIINKAISIKKKQIKKQIILDNISDDDEPIEEIKQKILKSNMKKKPAPKMEEPAPEPEMDRYTVRFI